MPHITAKARYDHLATHRDGYLRRARAAAALTIPALYPPQGASGATDYPQPHQSVGARGVNNLSSKLLLALLPPSSSFVRLTVDQLKLQEAGAEEQRAEFETALSQVERAIVSRFEQTALRVSVAEALKHLIVGGNVLLQVLKTGKVRTHGMNAYVVNRDGEGTVLEIVIEERLSKATAPQKVLDLLESPEEKSIQADKSHDDEVLLYTRVWLEEKTHKVQQETEGGQLVPDSEGSYPALKSPWVALRWTKVDGESYARSMVEEYIGDLAALDAMEAAIEEFAAVAAWIVFLADPGGITNVRDLVEASSGEVVAGQARDIDILQIEKFADFKIVAESAARKEGRLEQAFLLMSGIQRQAERVTAEEIRRLAEELEEALGGVYTILSEEMVRPLASRVMAIMVREGTLPSLPDDVVNLRIVTGIDALGRNQDLNKMDRLAGGVVELFGPETVSTYFEPGEWIQRRAAALGLDIEGLVRTSEQVQQIQADRNAQAIAEKAAGPAVAAAAQQQQPQNQPQ